MNEYLTVIEAAKYIGVSGSTVRKYIRQGAFTAKEERFKGRFGKRYLIPFDQAEDFFEVYRLVRSIIPIRGRIPNYQIGA